MSTFAPLLPGDPAPWFRQRCTVPQGSYTFDMSAGRPVVLFFFSSSLEEGVDLELGFVRAQSDLFDGRIANFFGVVADADDETPGRLLEGPAGVRFFWDADGAIGRLYGARPLEPDHARHERSFWVLLDPMLRVVGVATHKPGAAAAVISALRTLVSQRLSETDGLAPVLSLGNVFEPEFCARLLEYYETTGSVPSGVFTEQDGRSKAVSDLGFKRRRDCAVREPALVQQIQARVIRRVVPEIRKVFQFEASRLERLIIACYDAADRGCFGPHRDNTVTATVHRRFAVSINLNDGFEGGGIAFPEFGSRLYRPGTGGALIFSCSLMHAVTPVTSGRRYACLPFVYDDAAAQIKQGNRTAIQDVSPVE